MIRKYLKIAKWIFCLSLLASCYKSHLYVQQEKVDANFLASSFVNTPDPRQEDPPIGQRLLIAWDFPLSSFRKHLQLKTTVRLWDQSEKVYYLPLERKRDSTTYFFPNKAPSLDKKILTYRIDVFTEEGEILESWEHHFWTKSINVDREESL